MKSDRVVLFQFNFLVPDSFHETRLSLLWVRRQSPTPGRCGVQRMQEARRPLALRLLLGRAL